MYDTSFILHTPDNKCRFDENLAALLFCSRSAWFARTPLQSREFFTFEFSSLRKHPGVLGLSSSDIPCPER